MKLGLSGKPDATPARVRLRLVVCDEHRPAPRKRQGLEHAAPVPLLRDTLPEQRLLPPASHPALPRTRRPELPVGVAAGLDEREVLIVVVTS